MRNKGYAKTVVNNNGKKKVQKVNWAVKYNGERAIGEINVGQDGWKKHYEVNLNNNDLAKLFNAPTVNEPIHKRIDHDFLRNDNHTNHTNHNNHNNHNNESSSLSSLSPFSELDDNDHKNVEGSVVQVPESIDFEIDMLVPQNHHYYSLNRNGRKHLYHQRTRDTETMRNRNIYGYGYGRSERRSQKKRRVGRPKTRAIRHKYSSSIKTASTRGRHRRSNRHHRISQRTQTPFDYLPRLTSINK